MIFLAMK